MCVKLMEFWIKLNWRDDFVDIMVTQLQIQIKLFWIWIWKTVVGFEIKMLIWTQWIINWLLSKPDLKIVSLF